MPSSMTHTYFGMDVYDELPERVQAKIKEKQEYFKLFSQGSDPFMFYHFFVGKRAKRVAEIQAKMHHSKTRDFFISVIKYIHENKLQDDGEVMSFLYGYICHYCLDCYAHPFIYYKSGCFKKDEPATFKYNGIHQEIEYTIDMYLIKQKENVEPKDFKVYDYLFKVNSFSSNLKSLIKISIGKNYEIENSDTLYLKSIWYMKKFFKYVNYDPHGWKLKVFTLVNKIMPPSFVQVRVLSYHNDYQAKLKYLNLEHNTWYYPWSMSEKFTSSFLDIYDSAKNRAVEMIMEVTDILEEDVLDIKRLKKIFLNLDFATGRPCYERLEYKYFEV